MGDEVRALLVDADDPAPVEQHHETHCVEACVGAVGFGAEHVEIGPLITRSNVVGYKIGKSAGFVPARTRPT
jgi:hypothetical protein